MGVVVFCITCLLLKRCRLNFRREWEYRLVVNTGLGERGRNLCKECFWVEFIEHVEAHATVVHGGTVDLM